MKSGLEKLQEYNDTYTREVLLAERYTPSVLLDNMVNVLGYVKSGFEEIRASMTEKIDAFKKLNFLPTISARTRFGIFSEGTEKQFIDVIKPVMEHNYTTYSSLKLARPLQFSNIRYKDALVAIIKTSGVSRDASALLRQYKVLIAKTMSGDKSTLMSVSDPYFAQAKKTLDKYEEILKVFKDSYTKNNDSNVKVSAVISNNNQWSEILDILHDMNNYYYGVLACDMTSLMEELDNNTDLISSAIVTLSDKDDKNWSSANSVILSNISTSSMQLAKVVTAEMDLQSILIETFSCIYDSAVAIKTHFK